uniref:Ig-like domain-containing protein n=1 Tax=Pygocentrus nattereri TaxID=42514 RepID=A0AAR2LSX3_PYGNA
MLLFLFRNTNHRETSAQTIEPLVGEVHVSEGDHVTLSCNYSNVYLFWYRQSPNRALQYLLQRGARTRSGGDHTADDRFESTAKRSSTLLTVGELRLADTALYYCALQVIGTQ